MLSLGKIPPTAIRNPNCNPKIPPKSQFSFPIRLCLNVRNLQNVFHCSAFKAKKRGPAGNGRFREFEEDFDDEIFDDGEFEEDDNDDDEGVNIPFRNMKRWLQNRPVGFGEGKVYDTSIEDKLMEEIEQSRKAQLANLNKLKQQTASAAKKETGKQDQGSANVQNGFRVRLTNLPKKKNIHRDLSRAFNGVPGILDIIPVVSGNEKTRDPVCKGIAFVHFRRLEDAQRFVQNFLGKSISFGRVEKQIQCEIMDSKSSNPASAQQLRDDIYILPKRGLDLDVAAAVSETDVSLSDSWEEIEAIEFDDADEGTFLVQLDVDDDDDDDDDDDGDDYNDEEIIETSATVIDGDLSEQELDSQDEASLVKKKGRRKDKAADGKRRKDKNPKTSIISGSAKRLKMKDKAVLTGVFSKYAANAAVKEQSR